MALAHTLRGIGRGLERLGASLSGPVPSELACAVAAASSPVVQGNASVGEASWIAPNALISGNITVRACVYL